MENLKVKQHYTSVKYPHRNEQEEIENIVMLREFKRSLKEDMGNWVEEFLHVVLAFKN